MGVTSRRRTQFPKTIHNHETQHFLKCAHLSSTKPTVANHGRRPTAEHDPSRNESPLRIGDFTVGGALNVIRREQPPETKQITSKNWRHLTRSGRPKGAREPPSDKPTDPKWVYLVSAARLLYKNGPNDETQPFGQWALLPNAKPNWAKQNRRPNAKHDPNRNKTPLIIGD